MIIGLVGEKNSGKDSVAAYLIKEYGFERKAFADPLKRSIAALFDIPYHEIEHFKNDPNVFISVGYKNSPPADYEDEEGNLWQPGIDYPEEVRPSNIWSPISEIVFRNGLQRYGDESHRRVFGDDFWLDLTLPVDGFYTGRKIVISDCRYENEGNRIADLGGHIVRIINPKIPSGTDPHDSENFNWLSTDIYQISNKGNQEDLFKEVENMLEVVNDVRI